MAVAVQEPDVAQEIHTAALLLARTSEQLEKVARLMSGEPPALASVEPVIAELNERQQAERAIVLTEVEDEVEPEARSVGRHGVVTEERALSTARDLQAFTTAEFAEALGLKAFVARRWLSQLLARKPAVLERTEDGDYRSLVETVLPVEALKWAQARQEPFSPHELGAAVGLEGFRLHEALTALCRRNVIVNVGLDGMDVYEHPRLNGGSTAPITVERGTVEGTGKKPTVTNAQIRQLIEECKRLGASVERARNGHWDVLYDGHRCQIPATPSNGRAGDNARARLRRIGLEV